MSRTTIINIMPGERLEEGLEFRNSWGSAPFVWDKLNQKYLSGYENSFLSSDIQQIWDLWKDPKLPIHHRAVMMMTFDKMCIVKANYRRAAKDIRNFLADFPSGTRACHWWKIAEILEAEQHVPAMGIWQTSVSENPYLGEWNEAEEKYEEPEWEKIWDIYEELDKKIRREKNQPDVCWYCGQSYHPMRVYIKQEYREKDKRRYVCDLRITKGEYNEITRIEPKTECRDRATADGWIYAEWLTPKR